VRFAVEDNGRLRGEYTAPVHSSLMSPPSRAVTGLGLAMVKKVVDEHGAHIEAVNRNGGPGVGQAGGAAVTIVFLRLVQAESTDSAPRRVA